MFKSVWNSLAAVALIMSTTSCEKDDKLLPNPNQILPQGRVLNQSWYIEQYVDEHNETYIFQGITFEFEPNGSVKALLNNQTVNGLWKSRNQNGLYEFKLNFGNHPLLAELNDDDWLMVSMNDSIMELRDDEELLIFKKGQAPNHNMTPSTDTVLIGLWSVLEFIDDNLYNETYEWSDIWLNFKENELQLLDKQGLVLGSGTWFTRIDGQDNLLIIKFYGHELAEELNETWHYNILANGHLELIEHRSSQPDKINLHRSTLPVNGNPTLINQDLLGNWSVHSFLEEGQYNETQYWAGLNLGFSANGLIVTSSQGNIVANGTWQTSASGSIPLIQIQIQGPYHVKELNEVWQLRVLNPQQVELKEHNENSADVFVLTKQ